MKKIFGSKKGYTFVELLAVVAILAIIAAAGIITFVNVRKDLQLKAYDANAKELYLAAQNQMLQLKEYGQWDALLENHKDVTNVYDDAYFGGKIGDDAPSDFEHWKSVLDTASGATAKTWDAVKANMRMVEVKASEPLSAFAEKILPLGSIEDGVRTNGTYIIEYNIETAEIYSVFYTESGNYLDSTTFRDAFYGEGGGRPTDGGSSDNSKSIRRDLKIGGEDYVVGYFGGGMLSESVEYTELQIPDVILKNGEDLVLSITDVNSKAGVDDRAKSSIKITVTGMVSGKSMVYNVFQPSVTTGTENLGYFLQEAGTTNSVYLVKTCKETADGISYEIVLDSLTREIPTNVAGEYQNAHFAHNFGDLYPGEDIEVTVTVGAHSTGDTILLAVPVARRVEGNSLFAGSVTEKGMGEGYVSSAEVQQLRHFENISEAISGVKLKADCTVDFSHSISFNDKGADVDDILPVVPKDYTDKTITYLNDGAVEYPEGSFVPVDTDKNITVNGNDHNIYNLQISSPNGDVAGLGLFGTVSGNLTVNNLGIVSSDYVAGDSAASCEVKTLYSDVDGKAAAIGAFVGEAGGATTLNNCWSTVLINQTRASGANVGGMVGISTNALIIENCYVSGKTDGGKFLSEPSQANIFVNAENTVANGEVNEGGFVGKAQSGVTISNSYVTASVGIDGLNNAGTYNVGGFVGYIGFNTSVANSYFAGYLNMPLGYYVGDDSTLNYSGFVGNKAVGVTSLSFDSSSYWIKDFLILTDVEMNSALEDCGKALTDIGKPSTTTAYPYDIAHKGAKYPFTDVTGLSHHWGDWTTEAPDVKILIVSDIGINKINSMDTTNGEIPANSSNSWVSTDEGKSYYRYVSQDSGLKLNLPLLVKANYLTGFKGLAFTDLNEAAITNPEAFEADKRSAVIYASAATLKAINLNFKDAEGQVNDNIRNIQKEQIYNKTGQNVVLNMLNTTEYDSCVNVCYFFSVTDSSVTDPDYRNLKMIDGSFQNLASILCADSTDNRVVDPIFHYYSKCDYTVPYNEHYGKLNYKIRAFAYYADLDEGENLADYIQVSADGTISIVVPEGKKLPRIVFSEIPVGASAGKDELSFSVDLFRCKVSFGYTDSQIGGFYTVNGNKGDGKTCYVEYGSATLYDGPGGTDISYTNIKDDDGNATGKQSIVFTKVSGDTTVPPIPVTDYEVIADFFDWHNGSKVYYLYESETLSLQSVDQHTMNSNGSVVWVIDQKELNLTPKLEYIETPRKTDLGGGY